MNEALMAVIQGLPRVELADGAVLVTEGQVPDGLYFLESGTVEVFKRSERVARESTVGAVFGEMALLLESCATATVRAAGPCSFRVARDGAAFLRTHPEMGVELACLLANRLEAITRYVADFRAQFREGHSTPVAMVEGVVDTLLVRQPRRVERKNRGH